MNRCLLSSLLLLHLACSPGDSDLPDTNPGDASTEGRAESTDTIPPKVKDLRVELSGATSALLDLNLAGADTIVPVPVTATFSLFATDDETSVEDLAVTLQDGEGAPVPPADVTFANNLWHLTVELAPGTTITVAVADEAGNRTDWPHALHLLSLQEAIVGDWEQRTFAVDHFLVGTHPATFDADGTWEESLPENGTERGGVYELEEDRLTITQTWSTDKDEDPAPDTPDSSRTCPCYVDATTFHDCPWLRTSGETEGLAGTWERNWQEHGVAAQEWLVIRTATDTWTFHEKGTWQRAISGQQRSGEELLDFTEESTGTWTVEANDNYVDDFGDFLILSDDSEPEPPHAANLFRIRHDRLLLSPRVRVF